MSIKKLLINDGKSNNSDVISNQQIEKMAKVIKSSLDGLGRGNFNFTGGEISTMFAKALYNAGYRKQSEVDKARLQGYEQGKRDKVYGFSAEELAQKIEGLSVELKAMRGAANSYKMHYENLVREIFEEIEKIIRKHDERPKYNLIIDLAELEKKYTEGGGQYE